MIRNLTLVILLLLPSVAVAEDGVDLELVLLADASRSIDDDEIRFQRQGYAAAITHPDVLAVIAQGYDQRIAVTYVEWGDADSQEIVVPWTVIDGKDSASAFAAALMAAPRKAWGPNAIGNALAFGLGLIETNDFRAPRQVIDLSADSASNFYGMPIYEARRAVLDAGVVINGLAVECRRCSGQPGGYDLEAAFEAELIGGPGSFVVTADGDLSFAQAVRKKLILEIAGKAPDTEGRQSSELAERN